MAGTEKLDRLVDDPKVTETQDIRERLGRIGSTALTARIRDQHGDRAVSETRDSFERFSGLSESKKLSVILGFEEDGSVKPLPADHKFVSITVKRSDLPGLKAITADLALDCDDSFEGDHEEVTISKNFVIPDRLNALYLAREIRAAGITAEIVLNRNQNSVLHLSGGRLIPLAANLYSERELPPGARPELHFTQVVGNIDREGRHRTPLQDIDDSKSRTTPQPSAQFRHDNITLDSLNTVENNPKIPPDSYGLYLAIDLDNFERTTEIQNPILAEFIPNTIRPLINSGQFHVVFQNGFLCLIATAETLGRTLIQLAEDLHRSSGNRSATYIGECEIQQSEGSKFTIKGLPNIPLRKAVNQHRGGLNGPHFVGAEFNQKMLSGETRDIRGCRVESTGSAIPELSRITKFSSVFESYKIGGPRHHVGATADLMKVSNILLAKEARVIVLEGPGGIGKSSTLDRYVQNGKIANPVKIFINPGEAKIAGSALASTVIYLAADANQRCAKGELKELTLEEKKVLVTFSKLSRIPPGQRRNLAVQQGEHFVGLAISYLQILTRNYAQISPVFDNFEASDEASLPHLLTIIEKLSNLPPRKCQTFVTRRSEKQYASEEIEGSMRAIESKHGKKSMARLQIEGNDYRDTTLLKKFIIGCLEKRLRLDLAEDSDQYDHDLAIKYQITDEIVEAFRNIEGLTALQLTNLIAGIAPELEVNDSNVIIVNEVRRPHFRALARIRNTQDLSRFHNGVLNDLETKSPHARSFLTVLAITGGKINLGQIALALNTTVEELEPTTRRLLEDTYIVAESPGEIDASQNYRIHHAAFSQTVLESSSPGKRANLSKRLYTLIRNDETIDKSLKLALLSNIAPLLGTGPRDLTFWQEYLRVANSVFSDEEADHYTAALSILGKKDTESTSPVAKQVANPESTSDAIPQLAETTQTIQNLAMQSLAALAKSAVIRGRFDEVLEVIYALEKLHTTNKTIKLLPEIAETVYLAGFHAARRKEQTMGPTGETAQNKSLDRLRRILKDHLLREKPHERNLIEMRYLYNEAQKDPRRYIECAAFFYDQYLQPSGISEARVATTTTDQLLDELQTCGVSLETASAMLIMVKIRVPLEQTIQKLDSETDADCTMQPGTLTLEQTRSLRQAQLDAKFLERTLTERDLKINNFDLISLKEARAQLATLLGYEEAGEETVPFEEALGLYETAASMARRRGLHFEAARALELMGKTKITQALTTMESWPTTDEPGETKPKLRPSAAQLTEALQILKESLVPLANLPDTNIFQVIIHCDRVRAAGILLENAEDKLGNENYRQKATAIVREIVEQDLKYITEKWPQLANNDLDCYYWTYAQALVQLAKLLNHTYRAAITIPDCPLTTTTATEKTLSYKDSFTGRPNTRASTNGIVRAEITRKMEIISKSLIQAAQEAI